MDSGRQGDMRMSDELTVAIDEYYTVYRELQKYMNLRERTHFAPRTDGFIEIWSYKGNVRDKLLIKTTVEKGEENAEEQCYRKAAELVRNVLRKQIELQRRAG